MAVLLDLHLLFRIVDWNLNHVLGMVLRCLVLDARSRRGSHLVIQQVYIEQRYYPKLQPCASMNLS